MLEENKMFELILGMIEVLSEKQANVIVAYIGLISAAIVAGIGLFGSTLTIILNKRSERKVELRKIKESQYVDFLESLAEAKVSNSEERHKINLLLSSRVQTIYLVGSKEVQEALQGFLNIFFGGNKNEQDKLYATLIKAMKKDLYGKKEKSLDLISFTIFND